MYGRGRTTCVRAQRDPKEMTDANLTFTLLYACFYNYSIIVVITLKNKEDKICGSLFDTLRFQF